MKKRLLIVCLVLGFCSAIAVTVAALGFAFDILALGIVGCIAAAAALWFLAGNIYRDVFYVRTTAFLKEKDFAGARAILDRAESNAIFYPVVRTLVFQLGLRTAIGLDDVPEAARYVENLRHLGGAEWRYRTAYFVVMFNLDWDDVAAAREEYTDFRTDCGESEVYREQLEILDAVFAHIDGYGEDLPESAKNSEYPIVQRVLRKYC